MFSQSLLCLVFSKAHINQSLYFLFMNFDGILSIALGPGPTLYNRPYLLCSLIKEGFIRLVLLRNLSVLRVTRLRSTEEGLKGNQCSTNREGWSPFVLEDVKANSSSDAANVRVPYFSFEFHLKGHKFVYLRWLERIAFRYDDVYQKNAALIRSVLLKSCRVLIPGQKWSLSSV